MFEHGADKSDKSDSIPLARPTLPLTAMTAMTAKTLPFDFPLSRMDNGYWMMEMEMDV